MRASHTDGPVRTASGVDDGEGPPSFVHVAVMKSAEQDGVVGIGSATVAPRQHMVGVRVSRWTGAARPPTPAVSSGEQLPLRGAEESLCAPEVCHDTVAIKE